jgi:hypothetical protein
LDERKLGIFESPTGTVSIDIDSSFYVWIWYGSLEYII